MLFSSGDSLTAVHRFLRGRDSMNRYGENRRNSFGRILRGSRLTSRYFGTSYYSLNSAIEG
jgi:hypothetical protein